MGINREELEALEGWVPIPEVARRMGITYQRVMQLLRKGRFQQSEIRRIGDKVIVISERELERVLAARRA